jgi:hypothetical protein
MPSRQVSVTRLPEVERRETQYLPCFTQSVTVFPFRLFSLQNACTQAAFGMVSFACGRTAMVSEPVQQRPIHGSCMRGFSMMGVP